MPNRSFWFWAWTPKLTQQFHLPMFVCALRAYAASCLFHSAGCSKVNRYTPRLCRLLIVCTMKEVKAVSIQTWNCAHVFARCSRWRYTDINTTKRSAQTTQPYSQRTLYIYIYKHPLDIHKTKGFSFPFDRIDAIYYIYIRQCVQRWNNIMLTPTRKRVVIGSSAWTNP